MKFVKGTFWARNLCLVFYGILLKVSIVFYDGNEEVCDSKRRVVNGTAFVQQLLRAIDCNEMSGSGKKVDSGSEKFGESIVLSYSIFVRFKFKFLGIS